MDALQRAIKIAGTQSKLADRLCALSGRPVRQQHVSGWLRSRVPAEWCQFVSEATGVPVSDLRPDIFRTARKQLSQQPVSSQRKVSFK